MKIWQLLPVFLPYLLLLGHSSCEQLADPPLEAGKTDEQNYAIGNVGDPISVQASVFHCSFPVSLDG